MWGLDAARKERGASATEGRGGGGGSPGLQAPSPKAGDTAGAGKALAPQCRGALQGPRVSRPRRPSAAGKQVLTKTARTGPGDSNTPPEDSVDIDARKPEA